MLPHSIFLLFLFWSNLAFAQSLDLENDYSKPKLFTFIKNQPDDLKQFWRVTWRKENIWGAVALAVATGVLIAKDQQLYEETYKLGDRWKISHQGQQHPLAKIYNPLTKKNLNLLSGPNDLGTALYFLGDGWLHTMIVGGFLTYGLVKSDNRALQTSSQLAEAIIANGIVIQILKHTMGRENPNTLERPGGKWRWFPNQIEYHKHVNKYDAFPSGHFPTALITVTVIAENYPEYTFVRPIGYLLLGGLAFQMVNNGVHWWSDYPLSIYTGYAFAKIAINRGRSGDKNASSLGQSVEIQPMMIGRGIGLQGRWRF